MLEKLLKPHVPTQRFEVLVLSHPLRILVSPVHGRFQRLQSGILVIRQGIATGEVVPDLRFIRAEMDELPINQKPFIQKPGRGVQVRERLQDARLTGEALRDTFEKLKLLSNGFRRSRWIQMLYGFAPGN